MRSIRSLTMLPPEEFKPQMQQLYREAGVVLVLVPSIKRSHVSGVVGTTTSKCRTIGTNGNRTHKF
ncbi:MAG: hypothetical protein SAK29_23700 [Scytonema sp. PMC 1069.18]|nr:hypothetical protein [Scytonema sp. PMC 1069.18]MEC4880143.1 hypothetical protein [Scytonema sp. PMC 1070.18]